MVHLGALPGSPASAGRFAEVIERACEDARCLQAAGMDAAIIENFGDSPFAADHVDAATISALTMAAMAVRDAAPELPIGINVLRNDAISAMAIAATTGADFIRVNVLSGCMVTDQGLITGRARELLLERKRLSAQVRIAADVLVKHAVPLGNVTLEDVARDTFQRAGADALIFSGSGTGQPMDAKRLIDARRATPAAPLWVGSGVTPDNLAQFASHADALVVGTWLHANSDVAQPLDPARTQTMRKILDGLFHA